MTEIDDPEVLRREIRTMLEKVTDRGSLIFFQWMVRRVLANYPIPGDEELRALHQAFIRMHATFLAKKRPTKEDMELVAKWTEGDTESMGRALGRAVKFFREKRGMSRLQLAKKAGLPIRVILAIERGRVFDLSPVIDNLTMGLSVEAGELTDKLLDFEKEDKSPTRKG
jgi:DNA-binding XRE family transcriptional regulator